MKHRLQTIMVLSTVWLVVLLSPIAQAQTLSQPDQAELRATIATLLQQVQLLQQQLVQQQSEQLATKTYRWLDDFAGVITHQYALNNQLRLPSNAPLNHRAYAARLRAILPVAYRSRFDQLVVFTDHPDNLGAFVSVESDGRTVDWVYGVSALEINERPTSQSSTELMVHEFAHVFVLDQWVQAPIHYTSCHPILAEQGCQAPDSLYDQFVSEFYDTSLLDQMWFATTGSRPAAAQQFYTTYADQFVSDYAATNPAEDFAETFMWYVFDLPVERGSVAADKVTFMDQFDQTREYKRHITNQL